MIWKKKIAIVVVVLIAVYSITGFLVIPMVAESVLPNKLTEHLQRPASVKSVSFNPYTLKLSVEGVIVQDKKDESKNLIAVEKIFVNLQWSSLFRLALICKEIRVEHPRIRVARISTTSYSFSDLLSLKHSTQKTPEPAKKDEGGLRFTLSNISVSQGQIIYRDEPMGQTHQFSDIEFSLPKISNFDKDINTYAEPLITGKFNETQVRVAALTRPFADSMATGLDIRLSDVSLSRYFEYVPMPLGFTVADGRLDITSIVTVATGSEGDLDFAMSGTAVFSDLNLTDDESAQLLSVPQIHIKMRPSRILKNEVRIETLLFTKPTLTMIRRPDGELNLAAIGPTETHPSQKGKDSATEGTPLDFQMSHFQIQSGTVLLRDFAAPGQASEGPVQTQMADIELEVTDFANQTGQKANFDFSANLPSDGTWSMTGSFGTPPFRCNMEINLMDLDLKQAQPYLPDSVHANISDGRLHISGTARFQARSEDGMHAAYKGDVRVSNLAVSEAQTGQDLTILQSFAVREMDASWNPTRVDIQKISVSGLQQRLALDKDGQLNISTTFKKKSDEPRSQEKADTQGEHGRLPIPLSVEEIELSDLGLSFTDHTITPAYSSEFTLTEGIITGLSTADAETDFFLKGAVNKHAPFTIEGRAAPLEQGIMFDLQAKLRNLELSSLSPYARKYIGRNIERGKLNVDADYAVKDKQLEAGNHVLLDELILGQQLEKDVPIDLPVGLIVSLLKDRNGQIELKLPLSGRMDDPEFSLTGLVTRSLGSIFMNAATSPFSFASSLISVESGGEELRYIEFSAGSADLTKAARNKLEDVQKLLFERPKLNLVITGYVNPEKDRQALADQRLEEKNRQHMTVEDAQLRRLAERRSGAVKTFVLQDERIAGKRIFTRRPEFLAPPEPGEFKTSRVELDLQ